MREALPGHMPATKDFCIATETEAWSLVCRNRLVIEDIASPPFRQLTANYHLYQIMVQRFQRGFSKIIWLVTSRDEMTTGGGGGAHEESVAQNHWNGPSSRKERRRGVEVRRTIEYEIAGDERVPG
jgi:hypothetical protein